MKKTDKREHGEGSTPREREGGRKHEKEAEKNTAQYREEKERGKERQGVEDRGEGTKGRSTIVKVRDAGLRHGEKQKRGSFSPCV